MTISVDIETATGARSGAGPLATVTSWRRTRRLDRAGAISFVLPATDERAQLLSLRTYAHAWGTRAGARADLGLGIVDQIEIDTDARVLTVAGDDVLRELAMRPAGFLTLKSGTSPISLMTALQQVFTAYNALPVVPWTLDTTTYQSSGTTSAGSTTISAVTHIENWTGREGSTIAGAGIPAGATVVTVGASSLVISAAALASASGIALDRSQVFYQVGDESVLQLLIKLANATGTHFRLGSGRQIVWLYNARPASGIRAVTGVSPAGIPSNSEVCLITSLSIISDSSELVSRVAPYGAGQGSARLKLASSTSDPDRTTRTAPPGYTLDLSLNQLIRPSAETQYGYAQINRNFADISAEVSPGVPATSASTVTARNQLFDAAFEYLRAYSEPVQSYSLTVAKLDREILPGETIRVIYRDVAAGYKWVDLNADLLVLESTTAIDDSGVHTPELVVAQVDRWPENDQELLARMVREQREARAHAEA